uniref:Uncharacterized protein n=1 Tax=Physcomitrium patens TaxID=3218 RepID=A0A7I3ZDH7_PHYPA
MVVPVVGRPLSQVVFSEAKRNWPFVFGFGVTFTLVAKLSASLDRECSPFETSIHDFWISSGFFCYVTILRGDSLHDAFCSG